jgi:hypothetical protein
MRLTEPAGAIADSKLLEPSIGLQAAAPMQYTGICNRLWFTLSGTIHAMLPYESKALEI